MAVSEIPSEKMINDDSTLAVASNDEVNLLPPKPTEPLDSECCGTGCSPCVFDIYKKQLERWQKDCDELRLGRTVVNYKKNKDTDTIDLLISPEEYKSFNLMKIEPESPTSKIYTFSSSSPIDKKTLSSFHLLRIDNNNFPVRMGQHVLLRVNGVCRQYTILRVNQQDASFDILIKIYPGGQLTPLIDKLNVGDCVEMRGPFGKPFQYKRNSVKQIVMLAAGTGIAPFYRIVAQILGDEEDDTKIKLLVASQTVEEIPLKKQLKEWSSYWNFSVIYFCTKDSDKGCNDKVPYYGAKVVYQKIDLLMLDEHCKLSSSTNCDTSTSSVFLVCGTKSFEKDMINYLTKLSVDIETSVVVF